jgi:YD repeat-containing protein
MDAITSAKVGVKLKEMCTYMGIGADERHLFWIAELALLAKLPPHWRQYKDEEGNAYFHNHATNVTSWTHPRDGYFFEMVARERGKITAMKQLSEQQRRVKWDPLGRLEGIDLSNGNTTALHNSEGMYPSLRTATKMLVGTHCFQIRLDHLEPEGFVMIGMGKENVHYNADAIPPDDYNCHGYSTVGEIYVCGKLIESGLEKLHKGDLVTMVVHFDTRSIVWYRNRHPVGFYEGFEGTALYPCLVFGFRGYQASIVRAETLPHQIMKWLVDDRDAKIKDDEKRVMISNRNFTARSNAPTGYTTVRTSGYFDIDNPYFEVLIENLARDGFLVFGIGNQHVHESPTQIPTEQYNHFGYAASGEAFALGALVKSGLPRMQRGDVVGLRLLLDMQRVVFYLNNKPVVELIDLPVYEQYYPCCTLGNVGYQVKINPCPRIPLGVPRWLSDTMQPPRFKMLQDNMVAKATRGSQCVTVVSAVEYEMGKEYFEISLTAIHPEAELCVGIAAASVVDNFRAIPAAEHKHFGYCNNGDVVELGEVTQQGFPRMRVPDRLGILVDLDRHVLLFFHNGHPVALVNNNNVRPLLTPCITCLGQFEVVLDPTPSMPAFPPEWDPERAQDNIEVSKDKLTAQVRVDTESARTVWSTSVYNRGALYLEMQVELHGRSGWMVYGVGNRNLAAGGAKFPTRAELPYEEYYVIGYTSRGDIINAGAVERRGEEQWCNGDKMGLYIDFATETYAAFKNGHPVVVGNCPGWAWACRQCARLCMGRTRCV